MYHRENGRGAGMNIGLDRSNDARRASFGSSISRRDQDPALVGGRIAGLALGGCCSSYPSTAAKPIATCPTCQRYPGRRAFKLEPAWASLGGLRRRLPRRGIGIGGTYYGEAFYNRGGFNQGGEYDGVLDISSMPT